MSDIRTPDDEVRTPGHYYPPFRENWWYQGQTYPGHSNFAIDWNRRTKTGGWLDDTGDPVLAAADGTVAEVDPREGLVMLTHWGGLYRTEYRHMTGPFPKVGDKVNRGDRIGSIGNVAGDGRSFGAHLHHVHYRRDDKTAPWRRVKQSFYGKPLEVSVSDSDTKPTSWNPPTPVMVQGPPAKATWESAFKEAEKALDKAQTALAAQKAQTTLATEERDQARAEVARLTAERDALQMTVNESIEIVADLKDALAACEALPSPDCTEQLRVQRESLLDAVSGGVDGLLAGLRTEA